MTKEEQIYDSLDLGFCWNAIARCFGISRRTLYRPRQRLGISPQLYSNISDVDLQSIVSDILIHTPNAGKAYIIGSVNVRHLRV